MNLRNIISRITLATRRDQVDYINENRLSGLPGKEYTFTGTIKGDFPEGSLPTSLELVVKTEPSDFYKE